MKRSVAVALIFAGFCVGLNIGYRMGFPSNIWDSERNGLKDLNEKMKENKSQRIAILILTEDGKVYSTQSVSGYKFKVTAEKDE